MFVLNFCVFCYVLILFVFSCQKYFDFNDTTCLSPHLTRHHFDILLFLSLLLPPPARMKPVPAPTSSALMHSDSDLDSDDGQGGVPWTEQERGHLLRPQNGSLRNGQGPARGKKQREELL